MTAPATTTRRKKVAMLDSIIYGCIFLVRCNNAVIDSIDYHDLLRTSHFVNQEVKSAKSLKPENTINSVE